MNIYLHANVVGHACMMLGLGERYILSFEHSELEGKYSLIVAMYVYMYGVCAVVCMETEVC